MTALEAYGFVLKSNNMGVISYYRQLLDYTELLTFNNHVKTYVYKRRYNHIDSVSVMSYQLHKVISEHVEKELYWK
jgi:hypothetical protein